MPEDRSQPCDIAGDDDAFVALARRHQAQVLRLVGRVLPGREDAEDVVQEAIMAAYRQRRAFRHEASFGTWLTRIALRMAVRKSRRNRRQAPLDCEVTSLPAAEQDLSLPLLLGEALRKLPEEFRIPLVLRFYEDLSGAEIAALLGWKQSTVWTRLYRGLEMLRRDLEEGEGS
ncbi:MAG TPA: RNA polymerase sigma factor [Armatimonadota bacterium]|jgi:RNA polymerase sigma-70 factor (ECF subfamily)